MYNRNGHINFFASGGWVAGVLVGAIGLGLGNAASAPPAVSPGKAFTDITDRAGVRHRHEKVVLDPKLERIMP